MASHYCRHCLYDAYDGVRHFGIVSDVTSGRVPLAYIFALVAMLLTAFSYARLSQQTERPGSAYTYTAESCGTAAGFFVGWCSLLDYILLPLINALLAGIYLNALMPAIPYAVWVFIAAGLVTLVNCFRIHILANLSLLFVFVPFNHVGNLYLSGDSWHQQQWL